MERLSMRKIHEILRLSLDCGLSGRQIAQSTGVGRTTVGEYLQRFQASGLTWPLPKTLNDCELEQRLFPPLPGVPTDQRPIPDWRQVQSELRRPGVTMYLLWQEYKLAYPHGFQYSWFCEHYRQWRGTLDLSMRQEHRAGDKLFVDYAGQTVGIVDRTTGEIRPAQVFVAVLGASNYTYAEATWSQQLSDWIGSHVRAFQFFGGVSAVIVPDNLKSGVHKAHRYEPDLNPTYVEMASHYGTSVMPARSRKPKDKAKVEGGVLLVERWILAALRNRTFFSLHELNQAIGQLLDKLNRRAFKKLPGSRLSHFETIDKPALQPLPAAPYEFAQWKKARVHIDYHVEVDGHYYSVPHTLVKRQLDVRYSATTIECLHQGQRVASHVRSHLKGRHTTVPEHMPKAHREMAQWTPQRLINWAQKIGPATAALIEAILQRRKYPQQAFRTCLGILRLGQSYGDDRLEAASQRALLIGSHSYKSVDSILRKGLDRQTTDAQQALELSVDHDDIRGADYYH
ncbi:MAG: IS21 family transposase [Pseudomonadota bacterium]